MVNFANLLGTATLSTSISDSNTVVTNYGTISDVNDDNSSTYCGKRCVWQEGAQTLTFEVTIILSRTVHVKDTSLKCRQHSWGLHSYGGSAVFQYWNIDSSAWVTLITPAVTHSSIPSNPTPLTSTTEFTTNKVRYSATLTAIAESLVNYVVDAAVFEIILNGDNYLASGCKVQDAASVVDLALDPDSLNQVGFYDGSTVKYLALVDPTSADASSVRIYDGTAIKAIAKGV